MPGGVHSVHSDLIRDDLVNYLVLLVSTREIMYLSSRFFINLELKTANSATIKIESQCHSRI